MTTKKRVVVAGLFHETNSFLRGRTSVADFTIREGRDMMRCEGDVSPLAGCLGVARRCGWTVVPAVDMRAMPSGTVHHEVLEVFWQKLEQAIAADGRVDGVFLVLHGAMATEVTGDVEGELLRRLRQHRATASMPICGVVDLHANYSPAMARYADALVSYRENPHTDAAETAGRATLLLDELIEGGARPTTVLRRAPMILSPTVTATADEPMALLESMARQAEFDHAEILAINVLAGFAFADSPYTGLAFTAVTRGEPAEAGAVLEELRRVAISLADRSVPRLTELDEAIKRPPPTGRPRLLVEPADNIGAGAPGDITTILRALLTHRVSGAGVIIADADAVQRLKAAGVGAHLSISLGGTSGELGSEAIDVDVEVVSITSGRFSLEDRSSHLASMWGGTIDMGETATLRCHGNVVLVTSRKIPPFDLGQWRSQGVDPCALTMIGVKAAVAHRQAYAPIAGDSAVVDTFGPCPERLALLPYQLVRRPTFPLDPIWMCQENI